MFYNKIPEQLPTPNIGWEDGAAFVSPAALNLYIGQKCEIGIWGDDFYRGFVRAYLLGLLRTVR